MAKYEIIGGKTLNGSVTISGAKNAAVAILPAAILVSGKCRNENVPDISDVRILLDILRDMGAEICQPEVGVVEIDSSNVKSTHPNPELVRKMRASYYLMGSLLSRFGQANVALPGGCNFASRPIDQHIKGFIALGADVEETDDYVNLKPGAEGLHGNRVSLDVVSVGATVNIMMAATLLPGQTVIENAAKEPHIVDLANFLNSMGAKVKGAGTDVIRIRGQQYLHGANYAVIPDQIETGTLMIAAAATRGDVVIHGCIPQHMEALTAKLLEMGVKVSDSDDAIRVRTLGAHRAVNIKTQVYPGFPTDLQQPMSALLTTARGTSVIQETIFEQRLKHLNEIARMGARVRIVDSMAIIEGVPQLYGAPVTCTDLRAGAALVVAGLMAKGVTEIYEPEYIDRGYEQIEAKLRSLGADIRREVIE